MREQETERSQWMSPKRRKMYEILYNIECQHLERIILYCADRETREQANGGMTDQGDKTYYSRNLIIMSSMSCIFLTSHHYLSHCLAPINTNDAFQRTLILRNQIKFEKKNFPLTAPRMQGFDARR